MPGWGDLWITANKRPSNNVTQVFIYSQIDMSFCPFNPLHTKHTHTLPYIPPPGTSLLRHCKTFYIGHMLSKTNLTSTRDLFIPVIYQPHSVAGEMHLQQAKTGQCLDYVVHISSTVFIIQLPNISPETVSETGRKLEWVEMWTGDLKTRGRDKVKQHHSPLCTVAKTPATRKNDEAKARGENSRSRGTRGQSWAAGFKSQCLWLENVYVDVWERTPIPPLSHSLSPHSCACVCVWTEQDAHSQKETSVHSRRAV